jgi:TIR domain
MATIREYFDTDARALTVHENWICRSPEPAAAVEIVAKIAYDLEANAKYWYFYIPENPDLSACLGALFAAPELATCRLSADRDEPTVEIGQSGYSEKLSSLTLQFTKRVHLYLDFDISQANRTRLVAEALSKGYYLSIHDREYARKRSEAEKPLAFISHDSRDKDVLVRELAHEMVRLMCPVWYDEYSLKVGDSLRASIEKGLKETRKCIVVLSPNFLSNEGWTKAEFDSIFTREILEKKNVVLPVWHNVGAKEVYEYSPRLADKVGLSSSLGVEELARRLNSAVKSDS